MNMNFKWTDYDISMDFVETWLDNEAIKNTGLDDGFCDFYEYWKNENIPNSNFYCKVICENNDPFAVIAIGESDKKHTVMEFIIKPEERGKGKGTLILQELLKNSADILGQEIKTAEAVIYPGNKASKRAFEKAGFVLSYVHEDGDALYYVYKN